MTTEEIANFLKPTFPKATKQTVSLALRTHETGVQFCPKAKTMYVFISGEKPHTEKRKKPCRFTLRLTESVSERVKRSMERNQASTFQAYAEMLILERLKKEEAADGTSVNGF